MKYIATIALSFILISCCTSSAVPRVYFIQTTPSHPTETAIFKLPDGEKVLWKEISRAINTDEGIVECIPLHQTDKNWTDLIAVQYISYVSRKNIESIDLLIENFRRECINMHQGSKLTWNVIEKHPYEFIYEWILHEPYKDVPPQHEVARTFITDSGLYRVGFTYKKGQMPPQERRDWIKLLKYHAAMTSYDEASRDKEAFSLAEYSPALRI